MRSVALVRAFRRSPPAFLDELRTSGAAESPIRLGPERLLLLEDAGDVWTLLTTHARRTVKGRGMTRARVLLGDGLLTSEAATHQRHRRAVQEAFGPPRVAGYRDSFAAAARRTSSDWADGQQVDLVPEMSATTLDAVGTALFGTEVRDVAPRVGPALADLFVGFRLAMAPGGFALLRSPLPVARRVRRAHAVLDGVVDDLIRRRGTRPGRGGEPTVIDLLAEHPEFSDREIRDEVLTLFLAGHETTAMALTWAFAAIDGTPGLRTELEAEWDSGDGDRPLTTAVLTETMRMWPPSWLFTRRLAEPIVLGGRRLPAGMLCLVSPALLHRDPRWWPEPDEFRPARWLRASTDSAGPSTSSGNAGAAVAGNVQRFDAKAPGQPRGAYLPFGAGPRMCIGEQFARLEAVTMLAELGRTWRVHLDAAPTPGPSSMTLRPRGPVRVTVRRR